MVMMRALSILSFLFGSFSLPSMSLFAVELKIFNDIETQTAIQDCDFFDWFRSCKHPTGSGTASAEAGFISNGSLELVERRALLDAQEAACEAARTQAKANTPECDSFCTARFFLLEACQFSHQHLESGEGEAPGWFEACRLKFPDSKSCERYNSDQPFWAVMRIDASAEATRFCEKKGQRC